MSAEPLNLRRLSASDLPLRVAWLNDERINSTLNIQLPVTVAGTAAWFERVRANPNRADFVFENASGEIEAMGGFTDIETEVKRAELYIFVDPNLKGRGIGTRSVRLLCEHGFSVLGLKKIYLNANADNVPACKTYEKCGFMLEGIMRREVINNGRIKDRLRYVIFNPPPRISEVSTSPHGNSSSVTK